MSGDYVCLRCNAWNGQHTSSCDIVVTGTNLNWTQGVTVNTSILTYETPKTPYDQLVDTLTEYLGDRVFARRFVDCMTIIRAKNADYTQGTAKRDRIAAFRRVAADIDTTMAKVWATFAQKHWGAVMAFVKNGQVESEPIDGRINDLINYFVLLGAIVHDGEDR